MSSRPLSLIDQLILGLDGTLRATAGKRGRPVANRSNPAVEVETDALTTDEAQTSARLMRVNHAGEIAAQALYHGQAAVARTPANRDALHHAADEEADHLAWCRDRLDELGAEPSRLDPVWYAGSFAIGMLAGLAGDAVSLGFVAETERQVAAHLTGHLERLPEDDKKSRAIVEQMRDDEIRHGADALASGGQALAEPVPSVMRGVAKIMTATAYWV